MKTPSIIKEWLTEFKTLKAADESSYGATLIRRSDLYMRLTEFIEQCFSKDDLDPVLSQIFNCFRHSQREIYLFALQLLPALIYIYLRNFTSWKDYGETVESLETCLLGMYNLANTKMRTPISATPTTMCSLSDFRIPSLVEPSIYHEGLAHPSLWSERDDQTAKIVRTGVQLSVERRITAENRFQVLTVLQILYNDELACFPDFALRYFLTCFQRLVALDAEPRIPLSHVHSGAVFVGHGLTALYFCLFNGQAARGLAVLSALEERAMFELMAEVLLVVNAIRNSLETNPSGQPSDGPMGIKAELASTPPAAREARARGHTVITNASFRSKKLPEDITVDEDNMPVTMPTGNAQAQQSQLPQQQTQERLSVASNRPPSHSSSDSPPALESSSTVYVTAPSFSSSEKSSSAMSGFLSGHSRSSERGKSRDLEDVTIEMTKM